MVMCHEESETRGKRVLWAPSVSHSRREREPRGGWCLGRRRPSVLEKKPGVNQRGKGAESQGVFWGWARWRHGSPIGRSS